MQFAVSLPWWALLVLLSAAILLAWRTYAAAAVPVRRYRRAALIVLRVMSLVLLIACLLRPVRVTTPESTSDAAVAILVDVSRSMRLDDAGGRSRIEAAARTVEQTIVPALAGRFVPEVWTFGDSLRRTETAALQPEGSRTDLAGALREVSGRYRDRRLAAIVVVSDGGDTGGQDVAAVADDVQVPVHTVGVGSPGTRFDLEVVDVASGEAALADASVDISVSAVTRGSTAPFDIRLLENGRPIDVRRVTPAADGSPVRLVFTATPATDTATLYTAEIPSTSSEDVVENNRRTIVVEPPGRKRRLLVIEGAPGFEHSFMRRAFLADPGLEVDSVVRKGRDTSGHATYFVQADAERAPLLAAGFPKDRAALYGYDAIVLANIEPDSLTASQLEQLAAFTGERGGGLLVLGARSLVPQGLAGTPLEEVLPVAMSARDSAIVRLKADTTNATTDPPYAVSVTPDGARHPLMRIAADAENNVKQWQALPSLAGAAPVGVPRPGAQVLATIRSGDASRPLVAVQRYGRGRSMVFTGEASWRWRMRMPSTDRTYELFWRQAARWLTVGAPDRVSIARPEAVLPGGEAVINVDVRDNEFAPVAGADVRLRVATPGGATAELVSPPDDAAVGRYASSTRFDESGVYRVWAEARRGSDMQRSAERWVLVGGSDAEFAEPRLNDQVLRRLSAATGGDYFAADNASQLVPRLSSAAVSNRPPRVEELWHSVWIFIAVMGLLTAEWVLRRRWGLR
jgi:uncharacterized membrane protein